MQREPSISLEISLTLTAVRGDGVDSCKVGGVIGPVGDIGDIGSCEGGGGV